VTFRFCFLFQNCNSHQFQGRLSWAYCTSDFELNDDFQALSISSLHFFYITLCVSWIKRDQLDGTCFIISLFNAQHVSDVNTSILRSLRLICWVISWVVLFWFDVCWCYVVVWLGWCGILTQASACIRIPHHRSQHHNVTPTHIVPELYNPWNNSTNKSQAPEDGCINIRNMLSIK